MALRHDLFDFAIFSARIDVRLAAPESASEARGRAAKMFKDAKEVCGPSPILELEERDVLADPFGAMAKAGLFQIGLPGAGDLLDSYRAIAIAEQAIAAKTGLLGLASAFAARQMTARFFIAGFAGAAQRAAWLPRVADGEVCMAIAISGICSRTRKGTSSSISTTWSWARPFRISGFSSPAATPRRSVSGA